VLTVDLLELLIIDTDETV